MTSEFENCKKAVISLGGKRCNELHKKYFPTAVSDYHLQNQQRYLQELPFVVEEDKKARDHLSASFMALIIQHSPGQSYSPSGWWWPREMDTRTCQQ
jgi:hypothetical protein